MKVVQKINTHISCKIIHIFFFENGAVNEINYYYRLIPYDLVKSAMGKQTVFCVISDFRRHADENCALLGQYAANNGNYLPTFRDNLSVPSSKVKNPGRPTSCPQTSVRNYHYSLRNNSEERSSQTVFCFRVLFLLPCECC